MTHAKASSPQIFTLETNPDRHDDLLPISLPGVAWHRVFGELSEGVRCADWWQPVPMERSYASERRSRGKPVDIIQLMGLGLTFSGRAVEVLTPLVGDAIELLPLAYDGPGHFQVVNMLDIVDCLDEDRSIIDRRYSNGTIASVQKYVFKPGSTEGHHLFKCKQFDLHNLVSAEFKALVEENGLIGAYFTPIGE
ncbi:MAG TPA: DUF1629 domain-containing protein [Polyangia bacterium]|jgi:hypothetical protein|nr:DUF1629 domain-containing protein [Polyangia bacterium]